MTPVEQYVTLAPLGEGGMGTVHLGRKIGAAQFSRWVAIKRVHSRWLNNAAFAKQFREEIRLTASVVHPNVVQILDVVEAHGELLLVMEYIDGVTLGSLLSALRRRKQLLPIDVAATICVAALRGLHAAHAAKLSDGRPLNIVHRDVSPQNVMVDRCGHVRILDFGLANSAGRSLLDVPGLFAGRVAYFAPEQVEGRADKAERKTKAFHEVVQRARECEGAGKFSLFPLPVDFGAH